jgi:hypothetical protein
VAGGVSGLFKKQKKEKSTEGLPDTEEQAAEPEVWIDWHEAAPLLLVRRFAASTHHTPLHSIPPHRSCSFLVVCQAAPAPPAPEDRAAPTIELEEPAPAAEGERAPTPEPRATLSHAPLSVTPEPAMQKSAPGSRPTTPLSDADSGRMNLSDSQLDGADEKPGRKTSFMSKFKGGFKKH